MLSWFRRLIAQAEADTHQRDIETTINVILKRVNDPRFTPMEQVNILKSVSQRFKKQKRDLQNEYYNQGRSIKEALKEL